MIRLREVDAEIWGHAVTTAPFVPLQQSPAYAAALARRGRIVRRFLIEEDGLTTLGVQAAARSLAGWPIVTTVLRGPFSFLARTDLPRAAFVGGVDTLRRSWPHALILSPDFIANADSQLAMRAARLREIVSPASIVQVDLAGNGMTLRRSLRGKWRNRLVKAEAQGLQVDIRRGGAALAWLLDAHTRVMRLKRFRALPAEFVRDLIATSARRDVFLVAIEKQGETIAAALFLRHGLGASYVIAAATPAGRLVHAGNLALWQGLRALQEAGVQRCDLGQVDGDRSPALAQFKLGTGGETRRLCGTWTPSWL